MIYNRQGILDAVAHLGAPTYGLHENPVLPADHQVPTVALVAALEAMTTETVLVTYDEPRKALVLDPQGDSPVTYIPVL